MLIPTSLLNLLHGFLLSLNYILSKTINDLKHKKENMRDHASVEQLIILVNIESMNADMIREGIPMSERLKKLRSVAYYQMQSLTRNKSIERIKDNLSEKKY